MRRRGVAQSPCVGIGTFLAAAVIASAIEPPSAQPAETLSLDAAVAAALEHNRLVQSAALDVGRADDRLAGAKAQRWPTLSVTVLGSHLFTPIEFVFKKGSIGDFPTTGPIPAQDTKIGTTKGFSGLGLGQLEFGLSQQYKIGLNVGISKLGGEYYREAFRAQRQTTVDQVRKAFYGILDAESALAAAEESLALAREVERVVGDRFRAEKALEVDHIEAKARLARSDANAFSAQDSLTQQKEQLNSLLGRDIRTDFRVVPVGERPAYPHDLAATRARALEQQPAVRQARLQASQAELNLKLSKFIPDLGLSATYLSPFAVDFLPKNIFTVGLVLKWEVFDGGRRLRDVAEKNKQLEQARLAVVERESSALLDVGQQYRRFEQTRKSLAAAELERAGKRERLRIARDRYEQQLIIAEDLLRAQADLSDAEKLYIQALSAFWSARAELERAAGEEQ